MPQPVTASLSVPSIQRVAPAHSTASATQPPHPHQQALALHAVGNRTHSHAWEPNAGSARTTALQTSQSCTHFLRVLPSENVWAQKDPAGATQAPLDVGGSVQLSAQENRILEACASQLRSGWRCFQSELVAHAMADVDPAWGPAARQPFAMSAHQWIQDTAPSDLAKQPILARFLDQSGCMHSLLPATMKWLQAHTDVLERRDIAHAGRSAITAAKHDYLAGMAALMSGRFDQAVANSTLLTLFNALHQEADTPQDLAALQRVSLAQWAAWARPQGLPTV